MNGAPNQGGAGSSAAGASVTVREALRKELAAWGYPVASDTVSLRKELYVWGAGDRPAAVFEFEGTAQEAAEAMYRGQGRWTPELPPRFAVLPAAEQAAPDADFLVQAGFSVLFFKKEGEDILFLDFGKALEKIGRPAMAAGDD